MAETHVISGLKAKEEEIKKQIVKLRREIKVHQEDLDAIRKALRIFGESWRAGGSRLFRRGEMTKIVLDALRLNPEGLDAGQLAAIIIKREGFDSSDEETIVTIRQRCQMMMYRYVDSGKVIKKRRGKERVWRLAAISIS
jgi:hypothetical protein